MGLVVDLVAAVGAVVAATLEPVVLAHPVKVVRAALVSGRLLAGKGPVVVVADLVRSVATRPQALVVPVEREPLIR